MRRRLRKLVSLVATVLLVTTSIPIQPPKEVEAADYNAGQGQQTTGQGLGVGIMI